MADKTINELTAATTMGNDDLLVLQQGGTAKKLSGKKLGDYVYNAAAEKVAEVNKAVDDARSSINDIVESVQSMTELGTDTTLTTSGMAADAKVAGDKIKAVEAAAMADLSQGTASGSIVTITDGADNIPIKKMTVDIEPVQDLHGYDHPWPAGGSANVWDEEWEIGGISSSTGGNIDQTDRIRSKNYIKVTPLESYYLVNNIVKNIIANWYDSSKAFISGGASLGSASYAITIPENAEYMRIVIGSTITYSGGLAINYPSSVTTYAPYSNICPITGWTGAKVTRTGKNLLGGLALGNAIVNSVNNSSRCGISSDEDGDYVWFQASSALNGKTFARGFFKENTRYTFIWPAKKTDINSGMGNLWITYTDGTGGPIPMSGSSPYTDKRVNVFVTAAGKTVESISTAYYGSTTRLYYDEAGIFEGVLTAEDFEPYQGETYDITFPSEAGTVYGGSLKVDDDGTGTLTVDRAAVTLSSITWVKYSASIFVNNNFVSQYGTKQSTTKTLDCAAAYSKQMQSPADLSNGKFRIFGDGGLYIRDDTYTTAAKFKAGVQGIFIYELAIPLIYSLTVPQVKTLFGLNNIWADTGDISEFVYRKAPVDSSDIDAKITKIESIISGREATMTATKNYVSGSFVIVNSILYKLDANVASGETLTPGTNCHMTTVEAEIAERVPNYRSVNGKALSSDVTLTAEDILYDDSLSEHASGSVGEAVSDLNQQTAELSLQGKVVSILGDSISTYDGWTPVADGHNLTHRNRYINEAPWYTGTVDDTWWKKLIDGLGATLGINDSWAGSKVSNSSSTNTGDVGPDACMAGITRITNLGANGTPDIILFYGGTNDAGTNVTIGTFDSTITYTLDLTTNIWSDFATAYKDAIMRLQHYYPFAKIVVLLPTYTSTYYNTANLDKYNEVIKEVCDYFGVDYFDLRRCGINYANLASTLGDGVHPTVHGFALMENYVRSKLLSIYRGNGVENVVYSVTNILSVNQNADRYIKGISSGNPYSATITGPIRSLVKVEMGGIDITSTAYNEASGTISIQAVTGDIVISEKTLTQYTNRFSSASSYTNAVNTGGYGWADSSATASIINKPVNLIKIKTSASSGTLEIGVAASVNATAEQITQVQSVSFDSSMISGGYAYVKLPNTITLTGTQLIVLYPENAPDFIWYYRIGGISGTGFYTRVPVVRSSGTAWSTAADALLGFDYFYVS